MEHKAILKTITLDSTNSESNSDKSLVFPLYYFDGIQEFKSIVNDLKDDFQQLIGNTRIMFTMKKGSLIGNSLARNKTLSAVTPVINGFTEVLFNWLFTAIRNRSHKIYL